jgi:transposase-like protein
VLEEVQAWQARPLEAVYPILYFDCLFVKSRQEGRLRNKAIYLALGINLHGEKELLGLWMAETEGAKFWLSVFNELKTRGVDDCFIACVDGLKGLPEAIETVYPRTQVQLCIVHQVRNSLKYVTWKDRKAVAASLRTIYTAPTEAAASAALVAFTEQWGEQYSAIAPAWQKNWARLTPFFDYPPAIRKVVYTTNAIESLNYSLRKVIKGRGAFPHDDAIRKLLYLGLRNVAKKWTMPIRDWKAALNQFIILYGDRVPV